MAVADCGYPAGSQSQAVVTLAKTASNVGFVFTSMILARSVYLASSLKAHQTLCTEMTIKRPGDEEFTFFPPDLKSGEAKYIALVHTLRSVVLGRIGVNFRAIDFEISSAMARELGCDSAEEIARRAVGQALRDDLFNTPPASTVSIDDDAPRWSGKLTRVPGGY